MFRIIQYGSDNGGQNTSYRYIISQKGLNPNEALEEWNQSLSV